MTVTKRQLSKLKVMIKNVSRGNDDNAPGIEMDMVMQLLERTVIFVDECTNNMYERFKNVLLGVTTL